VAQKPGVVSPREGPQTSVTIARTGNYGICAWFSNSDNSTTTTCTCCRRVLCWMTFSANGICLTNLSAPITVTSSS